MKDLSLVFRKLYVILFSLCIFCNGCTTKDTDFIYQSGREWIFDAYFYNEAEELTDTIEVKMETKRLNWTSLISGQKGLSFEYDGIKEKTGFTEDKEHIFLHPPRGGDFAFTTIVPMPEVKLPPTLISESTTELKIVKSAFKQLNGQTVSQKRQQMNETEEFDYNGNQLLCYKIEGWNTSHIEEFGQYKVTYLFNERFGFVRLLYEKPDGSIVDIRLRQTNFY